MSAYAEYSLPPVCYIRHVTTGATVMIMRGQAGWHPANTTCSPECLNAQLPRPPTEDEVSAMRHGSVLGWNTRGCDPEMWRRTREASRW